MCRGNDVKTTLLLWKMELVSTHLLLLHLAYFMSTPDFLIVTLQYILLQEVMLMIDPYAWRIVCIGNW